jgi:frataxin
MMDETTYLAIADKTLHALAEAVERADKGGLLDIELNHGILTLTLEDKRQFVINRHTASRQVWMSSPVSGASHHKYITDEDAWVDAEGRELGELLKADLATATGLVIDI